MKMQKLPPKAQTCEIYTSTVENAETESCLMPNLEHELLVLISQLERKLIYDYKWSQYTIANADIYLVSLKFCQVTTIAKAVAFSCFEATLLKSTILCTLCTLHAVQDFIRRNAWSLLPVCEFSWLGCMAVCFKLVGSTDGNAWKEPSVHVYVTVLF